MNHYMQNYSSQDPNPAAAEYELQNQSHHIENSIF